MIPANKFDLRHPALCFGLTIPTCIIHDQGITVSLVIPAKYAVNGVVHPYRLADTLVGRTGTEQDDQQCNKSNNQSGGTTGTA